MDREKRAAEIITQIQYTTLATVTPEGLPWNSPVARVYDQELNFYWFSDKEGQHSRNVRHNGQVFIRDIRVELNLDKLRYNLVSE